MSCLSGSRLYGILLNEAENVQTGRFKSRSHEKYFLCLLLQSHRLWDPILDFCAASYIVIEMLTNLVSINYFM